MKLASKPIILLIFILLLTTVLAASSEGEEGHGFWLGFWKKALNSIILFGGLFYLLRKPISKFLGQKSLEIKTEIEEGEKTLSDKSKQMEEINSRLKSIEQEIGQLKEGAKERGSKESERIEQLGADEAKRVLEISEDEINNRIESAIKALKSKVADMAIDNFKQEIKNELDQKLYENLIEKNIKISGDIIEGK